MARHVLRNLPITYTLIFRWRINTVDCTISWIHLKYEIRLLIDYMGPSGQPNVPGRGAPTIHCSLETISLDEQPNVSFTAISYE